MLDKLIVAGILATIIFTALAYGAVEPWSVAVFEVMTTGIILLWGIKSFKDRRLALTVPATALPLVALLAIALVQSISVTGGAGTRLSLSMDNEATRSAATVLLFLLACFLIAANFLGSRERAGILADFLVTWGFAMAVFALVQHFTWNGNFYWFRHNTESASPFGPFANHNHFAGYMEMIVPVPVALMLSWRMSVEKRMFYGFAAAMMGIATLASLSRGGVISLMCGLSFVVLQRFRAKDKPRDSSQRERRIRGAARFWPAFARALSAVALLAVMSVGIFWIGTDPLVSRATQSQTSEAQSFSATRGWIWKDTLAMIAANPVLGVGLGAYGTAFPVYSKSDGSLLVPQSHNDYLQVAADCGIVGAAVCVWFLIVLLRAVFRGISSRDRTISGLALGLGGGIFAILFHSLFDFNLQIPSNALLFLVLTAAVSTVGAAIAQPVETIAVREVATIKRVAAFAGVSKRTLL